jgi:hypothetical protein
MPSSSSTRHRTSSTSTSHKTASTSVVTVTVTVYTGIGSPSNDTFSTTVTHGAHSPPRIPVVPIVLGVLAGISIILCAVATRLWWTRRLKKAEPIVRTRPSTLATEQDAHFSHQKFEVYVPTTKKWEVPESPSTSSSTALRTKPSFYRVLSPNLFSSTESADYPSIARPLPAMSVHPVSPFIGPIPSIAVDDTRRISPDNPHWAADRAKSAPH